MIFCRKITIETSYSQTKVLQKLRQLIETKGSPKTKSDYKGEFVNEGFIVVPKISTSSFNPIWVFGELTKSQNGTNVSVTIKLHRILIAIFWVFNLILGVKFITGLIKHSQDWVLFLGFLVFLWAFFLLQFWLEVKGFIRILKLALEESEDAGL